MTTDADRQHGDEVRARLVECQELARAYLVAFSNTAAQIDLGNRLAMMSAPLADDLARLLARAEKVEAALARVEAIVGSTVWPTLMGTTKWRELRAALADQPERAQSEPAVENDPVFWLGSNR